MQSSKLRHLLAVFILSAMSLLVGLPAFAQDKPADKIDFAKGVRAQGMGDAYTAVGSGAAGLYNNPAGIMRAKMYTIDGLYEYAPSGNLLNLTIVDSKLNPYVGAGVGYTFFFGHADNDTTGHDLRVTLGAPVIQNRISVGATVRWIAYTSDELEFLRGFTFDVGALIMIANDFHLGVSGRNLRDVCENAERCGGLTPPTVGAGLAYGNPSNFLIDFDFDLDLTSDPEGVSPIAELGAEYFAAGMIPIRAGFAYHSYLSRYVLGLGTGWRSKTASFEAAYQHDFSRSGFGRLSAGFSIAF